jgi:tryptophanyl-tRNA synthetase
MKKQRVLSGIQATGKLHLGNYIGAISQFLDAQEKHDSFIFVADLHALSIPEAVKPLALREKSREIVALLLACGIDPERTTLFIQSHIREHTELCWTLACVTPLGWLERMTQYKTKAKKQESVGTGLLLYPALQAADILLYEPDLVPVGEDQKQHIELTCDIAARFNHLFGTTFRMPKVVTRESGARIMGLDDPSAKMSKSTSEVKAGHAVSLLDTEGVIKKAIMSAVTDSGQETRFKEASPGVLNLLTIYELLSKESRPAIEARFAGQGYGLLKKSTLEVVMETLRPIQQRYRTLAEDHAHLDRLIKQGAERALAVAAPVMAKVRAAVGVG